jgi:hypothetical protein
MMAIYNIFEQGQGPSDAAERSLFYPAAGNNKPAEVSHILVFKRGKRYIRKRRQPDIACPELLQ